MIMGIVLFLVGLGLTGGAGWARWVAIILIAVNLLGPARLAREQFDSGSGR